MAVRLIKDYDPINHGITDDLLYNTNDWDLIELNYNIDVAKIQAWYDELMQQYGHLKFGFTDKFAQALEMEKSKQMVKDGYCGYYCGPVEGITLAWPTERYEPLPPPEQCNLELYPEVNRQTFVHDAKILSKFRFGYFAELVDLMGEEAFRKAVITIHHPGMRILQHRDSKKLKIHIPIYSNEHALFRFGPDGKDGDTYHMKVGKMYILNTDDWHGTSNLTDEGYKIHILTRVDREVIQRIISMTN